MELTNINQKVNDREHVFKLTELVFKLPALEFQTDTWTDPKGPYAEMTIVES